MRSNKVYLSRTRLKELLYKFNSYLIRIFLIVKIQEVVYLSIKIRKKNLQLSIQKVYLINLISNKHNLKKGFMVKDKIIDYQF